MNTYRVEHIIVVGVLVLVALFGCYCLGQWCYLKANPIVTTEIHQCFYCGYVGEGDWVLKEGLAGIDQYFWKCKRCQGE